MKKKKPRDVAMSSELQIAIIANLVSDDLIIALAKSFRKYEHKIDVDDRPTCAEITLAMLVHKLLGPPGRIHAHITNLHDIEADVAAMAGFPQ